MTTRTPRAILALALGAILVVAGGPASGAASDTRVQISSATTITGKGFGHGHGMSQYGARNAAAKGLTYRQILAFYYPGTAVSSLSGTIRVWITADTDHNTIVRPASGLKVIDRGSGKSYLLPTGSQIKLWRLAVVNGATRVSFLSDVWHPYRPGGRVALVGVGQFQSASGMLTLRLPSGPRTYRGKMRLVEGRTVNVVSMENYLKGVVASEMPAYWPTNALRAQAVAARTYAAWSRAQRLSASYQICDTTACQVYKGYGNEQPSTNAAIAATAGQILVYQGKPAFSQFSASNGGYTAAGSQPYLPAKPDPYDNYPTWTKPVDATAVAALKKAYPALGTPNGLQILTRDGKGAYGGRVLTIRIYGTNGTVATQVDISGSQFRSLLGMKSTLYTLTP